MLNERYMEQASALEEYQRNAGRNSIAQKLSGTGCDACTDCGCTIPEARRKVAPWATRCAPCQSAHEKHNPT